MKQPHQWTNKDPIIRFEGKFKDAWSIVASAQGDIIRNLAASGYASKLAASGHDSVCAIAANNGRVKVGKCGAFAIAYWDEKSGWHFLVGKEGEQGIKAEVWYVVENGKLIECHD